MARAIRLVDWRRAHPTYSLPSGPITAPGSAGFAGASAGGSGGGAMTKVATLGPPWPLAFFHRDLRAVAAPAPGFADDQSHPSLGHRLHQHGPHGDGAQMP